MALIKWSEEGGQVRLGLPGDLDLPMAQPLLDSLRHALSSGGDVAVLAEGVERVSTASVQALLVASRAAAEAGVGFAILRPSVVLIETCEDLGLAGWLNRWSQS